MTMVKSDFGCTSTWAEITTCSVSAWFAAKPKPFAGGMIPRERASGPGRFPKRSWCQIVYPTTGGPSARFAGRWSKNLQCPLCIQQGPLCGVLGVGTPISGCGRPQPTAGPRSWFMSAAGSASGLPDAKAATVHSEQGAALASKSEDRRFSITAQYALKPPVYMERSPDPFNWGDLLRRRRLYSVYSVLEVLRHKNSHDFPRKGTLGVMFTGCRA